MGGSAIDKPSDTTAADVGTAAEFFHDLTAERFLRLGVSSMVYFRSCIVDEELAYALHSADGVLVSVVEDIDTASMLAFKHGMAVVAVH